MSDEQNQTLNVKENAIIISSFKKLPQLYLDMELIKIAESRLVEAKNINPVTYPELSHCFNESYRVLKQHLSNVGYNLLIAEKALEEARADVILGTYADYLKDKPKTTANSELRNAFIIKDPEYSACLDRVNQLKAVQSNFEGKIKVLENANRYMNQKMYLISKSGLGNDNLYITSEKKYTKK